LSLTTEVRVGKKYVIYLPKVMVQALKLKEGGKALLTLTGNRVVLEKLQDPLQLALEGKKFASITPEKVEAISLEEQRRDTENPA
jgi:bifunctional DNA-binding transcriptional regulator/antitoxin component of YhaV-PrlF toxin-antitoxin module